MKGISFSEIGSWLVTFVAVFAGAWSAFRLNVRQKKREEDRRRVAQGNIALYTIFNMWNILFQYNKENIVPHKDKDDCWLNMPGTPPMTTGLTSFDSEGLAFLLATKETATVYAQVLIEEQNFGEIVSLVEMRNKILDNVVGPRFEEVGIEINKKIPLTQEGAVNIIGDFHSHRLKQLTDGIISRIEECIKLLESKQDTLRKTMESLYPKETFRSFRHLPEKEGEDSGG